MPFVKLPYRDTLVNASLVSMIEVVPNDNVERPVAVRIWVLECEEPVVESFRDDASAAAFVEKLREAADPVFQLRGIAAKLAGKM